MTPLWTIHSEFPYVQGPVGRTPLREVEDPAAWLFHAQAAMGSTLLARQALNQSCLFSLSDCLRP